MRADVADGSFATDPDDPARYLMSASVQKRRLETQTQMTRRGQKRTHAVLQMALQRSLLVQPHVLVTIAIIGAVHHDGDALDIGLPARAPAAVEDDRTSDVLLQLLVDLPDQLLALLDIRFLRLLVEQPFDVLVAVVRVVPLRAAGIVLVEGLVRIVNRVA